MQITREVLESYLACKYKAHLRLAGEQGTPSKFEAFAAEDRDEIRSAGRKRLTAHLDIDALPRGITVTSSVLRDASPLILNGTIVVDDLIFCIDGLKRTKGSSRLGEFHYLPVLFDETERPGPAHKQLMAIAGLAIASLQGTWPAWGTLIYGRESKLRRFKLQRNGAQRLLRDVREMETLGGTPRLTLNKHCTQCEFQKRCRTEAEGKDDLSLLRSLGESEIKKYEDRGIFTVTQLSFTFRARKRIKRSNHSRPVHNHPLQALAVRENRIYVVGTPVLPDSTTRIYFDLEGDPERAFDYLLGMIVQSNEGEERYSFWADSPQDELCLFQQFVDVVSRFENPSLYSYGSYEAAFIRRMSQKTRQPDLGGQLLSRLVNVLSTIYSHVYFPAYSNGLKEIARLLGFCWTEPSASGQLSVAWRRKWERTGSESLKNMLVQYNLEDCIALQTVTALLYDICPSVAPLDGPHAGSGEYAVTQVEDLKQSFSRPGFGDPDFTLPDFA
ncbi:MAG: TM0106 family RecB-like putative nuclease, partial [Planctomycetes bacterium]|nr:TM0106 family RecB-like putative nuclease [Planctomycetota bacterium]